MSLLDSLNSDLKEAMRAGDKLRREVIRGLKSDLKYKEIEQTKPLTEEDMMQVLSSAAKRRRDSIEQFQRGGRDDLVAKETAELHLINSYLPQQLTDDELLLIIDETISESGANVAADLGKLMKYLMPKVKGRADGNKVRTLATARLQGS